MKHAVIIGNGLSRLSVPIPETPVLRKYGCNAIYRDTKIDDLISVDFPMQYEIYVSGYAKNHRCWFTDWKVLPKSMLSDIKQMTDRYVEVNNNNYNRGVIVNGRGDLTSILHLNEEDKVRSLDGRDISAGATAAMLAAKQHYDTIYMVGFDGDIGGNVYAGTNCYLPRWSWYAKNSWPDEHEAIISEFPGSKFIYVNCAMKTPKLNNVDEINLQEWKKIIDKIG